MPLSITDGALAWQRLAVLNAHPRDERIQFEEESHTYTIDGTRAGWISCTGFIHHFFEEFNADAVITKMMASRKWSESKYFGMTPAAIKAQWDAKRDAASAAGTRMHLDIEHFYNALPAVWATDGRPPGETALAGTDGSCRSNATVCGPPGTNGSRIGDADGRPTGAAAGAGTDGSHIDKGRTVDIDAGVVAMREADIWEPNAGPEWNYFCDYQRSHGSRFEPFRTEWLVFDEEHKVAGSIDMVYKKSDGTLAIYDWKRSEEIKMENRFQSCFGPVDHLPDTNYWHYSLQLNIYRYILQKHYGYTVSELALVILHPVNSTWRVIKVNMMDDEIAGMMETRAQALKIAGNDGRNPVVMF